MRKLIVSTFLTLDGVMQAPGGPGEDDDGGFAHGGWSVNYWDEQMGQVMGEATSWPFAMVLGRRTYDIMAAHWPHASEEEGAKTFNDATKYVASRSRPKLEWSNSVLIEGDAAEGLAALKAEDGPELQVHGSGEPHPDAAAPQPGRPVPPVGLPPGHRVGQTPVLGRHHPLGAEARRQHGLHHRRRDRYLRAGGRDRHRNVRAGLIALGSTHRGLRVVQRFSERPPSARCHRNSTPRCRAALRPDGSADEGVAAGGRRRARRGRGPARWVDRGLDYAGSLPAK